jgi:hypothetical protein
MDLFDTHTFKAFEDGHWAKGLRAELKPNRLREYVHADNQVIIMPPLPPHRKVTWNCTYRQWHGTHQSWLQYEPEDHSGPFFWSGKPAIMCTDEALYAGYYIERGLLWEEATQDEKDRGQVMDETWDWHRFRRLIRHDPQGLLRIAAALPRDKRCVWMCVTQRQQDNQKSLARLSLESEPDLREVIKRVHGSRRGDWIDLVVGVEFTKPECGRLQYDIVNELVQLSPDRDVLGPLAVARDLHDLVAGTEPLILPSD